MRKITLLITILLLSMILVACGGGGSEEEATTAPEPTEATVEEATEAPPAEEGDCSSPDVFCVGLVTDVGEIDDKSFNQSAWEGVQQAEADLGAQVDYIETQDAKDYAANIGLFADEGYDVVVTVGFALGAATMEAACTYPDIDFIGVDQFQSPVAPKVGLAATKPGQCPIWLASCLPKIKQASWPGPWPP